MTATTYIIRELDSMNSYREGREVKGTNLTGVKRYAQRSRSFFGTILTIETGGGTGAMDCGQLVAYRRDGRWQNA